MSADYQEIRRLEQRIQELEVRLERAEAELCTPIDMGAVVSAVSVLIFGILDPTDAEKKSDDFEYGLKHSATQFQGSSAGEVLSIAAEMLTTARAKIKAGGPG